MDLPSYSSVNDHAKYNSNNDTSINMGDQQPTNPSPPNTESRFSPNTNSILYSFSLSELIDFHKKRIRRVTIYVLMGFGIISLIGLILLITSFIVPKCDGYIHSCSQLDITFLLVGASLLGTGLLIILLVSCMSIYQFKRQFNDLNVVENRSQPFIWRLDGEEWIHYLNYIHGPDREWTEADPLSSFCCRRSAYDRLIDRQYGHIVLYGNGLIIDELYFISFRQYSLQGIQLLTVGEHQQRIGLRIHTYLKAGKNSRNCYFDVFAPSSVSLQQLQIIAQSYNGRIAGFDGLGMAVDGLHLAATVLRVLS